MLKVFMKTNIRKILIFILMAIIIPAGGCKCKGDADDAVNSDLTPVDFASIGIESKTRDEVLELITGNTYYLDPGSAGNDDTGDGSSSKPWKTLAKAQANAKSGDGVILRSGNYGDFVEDAYTNLDCWLNRTKWIVYINEDGATPVFKKIRLYYPSRLEGPGFAEYPDYTDSYLIFWGITIIPGTVNDSGYTAGDLNPEWYTGSNKTAFDTWKSANPTVSDSMYPQSTPDTYVHTESGVYLWRARNVQIYNCIIRGYERNLTEYSIWINNSRNLLFEKNDMSTCWSAFKYSNTSNLTIRGNHLHKFVSSGISEGAGNDMRLIENNHIHDSNWALTDPYVPKASGANYHGSGMSLRYGNIVIRGNIFHDGWGSSGIMTYLSGYSGPYHNILIENNLIYDINTSVLRFYNAGTNIIVRNNTVAGFLRNSNPNMVPTNGLALKYYNALIIETLYPGYDGSGIKLYNNIFCGTVTFGNALVIEKNNIFWALSYNKATGPGPWALAGILTTGSKVVTANNYDASGNYPQYFATESFFNSNPDFTFAHGSIQDFTLNTTSEGINFGNSDDQPSTSLGILDGNNEFILFDGPLRNDAHHSAGCYEPSY